MKNNLNPIGIKYPNAYIIRRKNKRVGVVKRGDGNYDVFIKNLNVGSSSTLERDERNKMHTIQMGLLPETIQDIVYCYIQLTRTDQ
jgi:hypothetical protein